MDDDCDDCDDGDDGDGGDDCDGDDGDDGENYDDGDDGDVNIMGTRVAKLACSCPVTMVARLSRLFLIPSCFSSKLLRPALARNHSCQ